LQGVQFTIGTVWNDGIVEQWNIGYQKRMMVCFLFLFPAIIIRSDFIPLYPLFRHSSIPTHSCTKHRIPADSRKEHGIKDWPCFRPGG